MKKILTLIFLLTVCCASAQLCIPNTHSVTFDSSLVTSVDIPTDNGLDITDSITIEAWIYRTAAWSQTSAKGTIVCKHGWSGGESGYVLRAGGNGQLSFNIAGDSLGIPVSWREVVTDTAELFLNSWSHVAGTFDGYNLRLYINGVLRKTRAFTGKIVPSSYLTKIGRLADVSQPEKRLWHGKIDEVRIWHRALSQSEIAANMNSHIDPVSANGLVGYWRLNDGSGTAIQDLGSGSNPGVLTNGAWSTVVPFTGAPTTPFIAQIGPNLVSSASSGNQWYFNNAILPGETGTQITPTHTGNYSVVVTDISGCSATSSQQYVFITGMEHNPAKKLFSSLTFQGNVLHIPFTDELWNEVELKIMNMSGQEIIYRSGRATHDEIDLKDLNDGIYVIKLSTEGSAYSMKVAVIH